MKNATIVIETGSSALTLTQNDVRFLKALESTSPDQRELRRRQIEDALRVSHSFPAFKYCAKLGEAGLLAEGTGEFNKDGKQGKSYYITEKGLAVLAKVKGFFVGSLVY